jgi:hypothetical protein
MIKKQCPNCRDIFDSATPLCHRCGVAFLRQPKSALTRSCLKIGGFMFLFAGLIATTAKFL